MDDLFANCTAADIPVVPNLQELIDQYFFHLNTKVLTILCPKTANETRTI